MTIEDKITALLAEAAPLRLLPDAEAESMGLPGIVDMINALRAEQAGGVAFPVSVPEVDPLAPVLDMTPSLPVRRPGRPKKVS